MSIAAKRFIRSLLLRLFPKASEPMLVLLLVRAGNPNRGPGYRASLRTPDEGAHLVTRIIILNPRYCDPPPELSISLATFSPCTSHKPGMTTTETCSGVRTTVERLLATAICPNL